MQKEAAEEIAPFLKFIFNQPLTTGQVTGDRKCASVSPVFKKGSELKTLATTNQYLLLLCHVGSWRILSSITLWVTWMRIMYLSTRPHLEYACSVCDPHTQKNIQSIEKVQRRAARFVKKCNQRTQGTITSLLEELKWPSLEQIRKQTRLTNLYKIVNGTLAVQIPNYFRQKEHQTRNYHPLKFVNAGWKTNIFKHSFFPGPLKNETNFPKQLLKLPTQRPSSLPWWHRPGPIEHLNIFIFIFISPAQIHCTVFKRTQHEYSAYLLKMGCTALCRSDI